MFPGFFLQLEKLTITLKNVYQQASELTLNPSSNKKNDPNLLRINKAL